MDGTGGRKEIRGRKGDEWEQMWHRSAPKCVLSNTSRSLPGHGEILLLSAQIKRHMMSAPCLHIQVENRRHVIAQMRRSDSRFES
jgi:hypothetical protein